MFLLGTSEQQNAASSLEHATGYYDDDERHRFGTTNKKGQNRPLSNFSFTFVKKILAVSHASTGYVVEVTPECVGGEESGSESELEDSCNPGSRTKLCFFTSNSTMRKADFMEQLNSSIKEGGLTCSFNDFQLSEYIQQKRRKTGRIPVKHAVEKVGPQSDGSWVLSPHQHRWRTH